MPKSLRTIDDPFTAITINVDENKDLLTPQEWIKTPDSNYDILDGYEVGIVGGQQAVFIDDGLWAIFNTPDQKRRISISILLDLRNGAEPLYEEIFGILDSFSFIGP